MKIFNKKITRKQLNIAIGGLLLTAVGAIAVIGTRTKDEEQLVEGIEYVELDQVEEPIELDTFREEEA